jgi:hypothetical protein
MKYLEYFKMNESLTNNELAHELLSGATWIEPAMVSPGKWGVIYYKDKEKHKEGSFNTSEEVYGFLEEIGVPYKGKEGFEIMMKFRDKEIGKLPFQEYQKYLLKNGLKDFDIG